MAGIAQGRWASAVALLEEAQCDGVVLSKEHYSTAIGACTEAEQWRLALGLFGQARAARVAMDVLAFNMALGASDVGASWEDALAMLSEMMLPRVAGDTRHDAPRADVVSLNTALGACRRARQWSRAVALLSLALGRGVPALGGALLAAASAVQWPAPDVVTFNSGIQCLFESGQFQAAMDLLERLPAYKLSADATTYSLGIAVAGLARGEDPQAALSMVDVCRASFRAGTVRQTVPEPRAPAEGGERRRGSGGAHKSTVPE